MRRAKIVATLGPALDDPARLRAAIGAGIDVVRLNFSHGSHDEHERRLEQVRATATALGRNVGALGDLQGPKIRLGILPDDGVELADGGEVLLQAGVEELDAYDDGAGTAVLPVVYEQLADDVEPGALILIDDGLLRLVVSRVDGDTVSAGGRRGRGQDPQGRQPARRRRVGEGTHREGPGRPRGDGRHGRGLDRLVVRARSRRRA